LAVEGITRGEVEEAQARVAMAGGKMTPSEVFIDLLWQEYERVRLGLCGAKKSAM
jgi:hypothetical protein